MGNLKFNAGYIKTDRGVVRLVLIILGLVASSFLCGHWYGGTNCFGEGRLGYASGLNSVFLLINIVLFILSLLSMDLGKFEHIYSAIGLVLFAIAAGLLIWYIVNNSHNQTWLIATTVCLAIQFLLYIWDFQATKKYQGHLPI